MSVAALAVGYSASCLPVAKDPHMSRNQTIVACTTAILLALTPCLSFADPGNGKGHGQGQQQPGNSGGKHGPGTRHGGPSIDRGHVLGILDDYRDYWGANPALPPGIQKNLARGKPLPPGIAKKLDGRLLGQLPRYQGYEWKQVGVDLILVAVATGLIYEVLEGAFD